MANMSPTNKSGIKIPVEFFAPQTRANPVTISEAIPLIPDLETPSKKAHVAAIVKLKKVGSDNTCL